MKTLFLLLAFFISTTSFCQLKQKMADDLFSRLEYYKCVEMYEEMADKVIKGGTQALQTVLQADDARILNVRRAAISNYKLLRMEKSILYFRFLERQAKLDEKDREYYIQALRFIGQNQEAQQVIEKSHTLYPNNVYFTELKSQLKHFNSLFSDSADIKIAKTGISSSYGDFSPVFFDGGLVYATKSKRTSAMNSRYKWDNSYFVSLMYSKFDSDKNLQNGKLLHHQFLDKAHDGPVAFTPDQKTMVITKNKKGGAKDQEVVVLALYFSQLIDGKWTDLTPFEYNSDLYSVGHGCFSDDGKTLYFVSDMPGGYGQTDIYRSRFIDGKWTKPQNLGTTYNTNQQEMFPFVVGDKLYFSSNGHFGLGGLDLFEVDLSKDGTPGGKPRNMKSPINSPADDFALICDKDGTTGYFSTNRTNAIDQIYSFQREDPQIELIINLYEKYTENQSVAKHPILVKNTTIDEQQEYITDENGQVHILISKNETYVLTSEKEEFNLLQEELVSSVGIKKDTILRSDIFLLPTKITIALLIVDKDTRLPLHGANALIQHGETFAETTEKTDQNGLVYLTVDRRQPYTIFASHKGYMDGERDINTSSEDGKIFDLELALPPIKKGEKFVVDNIFYDYDKASLRSESTAALDRLADFLLANNLEIELSSHTDSRGSNTYNQKLSQARAQSCVDYLIAKGVAKSKMKAKGYGETQLVNRCKDGVSCDEEEHQENRRTEVKILDY